MRRQQAVALAPVCEEAPGCRPGPRERARRFRVCEEASGVQLGVKLHRPAMPGSWKNDAPVPAPFTLSSVSSWLQGR